jgi:hypothetical protein
MFGIALGRALRSNPLGRLRSLDLGGPNGDDAGAGIADSGMVALCDALVGGALPVLEYLCLDGNEIGNPGAIALGAAASRVGVLEHCTRIDLGFNDIDFDEAAVTGALCLALCMGGLPLVRVITGMYSETSISKQLDQLMRSNSCGQRPFVGDLAVVESMKALSDRLAKELRQAAMAPLTEGTPFPVRRQDPCLARLEEAWQEDGPAVLELLAPWLVRDGDEDKDESSTDSADMSADSADESADMHGTSVELINAVKMQDVEKVKVRRPLEAVPSTEYGPSRGVCLGLGQWTLEAFRRTPDSAWLCRIQPLRQAPLRQF